MLEGLIFSLLNSYLGGYVEFDKEQLKVGLWSGRLGLKNLIIKPSVIDRQAIPVELVKGGTIANAHST